MASLNANAITRLSSTTVGMQTVDGAQTLYTVPTGKVLYISHIVVRDPTGSLAGGTDFDFTNFRQTVDLSAITGGATNYIVLDGNNAAYVENAAATAIQITPSTGATADVNATIDLFGYLV